MLWLPIRHLFLKVSIALLFDSQIYLKRETQSQWQ
jgi:hypothetical protein